MASNLMKSLVAKANEAKDSYYNEKEIMSDYEYNQLESQIEQLEKEEGEILPDSPTVKVGAPVNDKLPKYKHPYPAKSLDKTKDINEIIKKFSEGVGLADDLLPYVVCMYKLDGSTGQAYYNHGKLQHFVTRGNGEVGSDVTHNASSIAGVPLEIPFKGELVVRGEVVMSYEDFDKVNSKLPAEDQYKNPRNLAAASLSLLNPAETKQRNIAFIAFNLVYAEDNEHALPGIATSFEERLITLYQLGFDVVERQYDRLENIESMIESMTSRVDMFPYPVDGLVLAYDNYAYTSTLQGTEHHPHILSGFAFKWADEAIETTLREIEWSPSRTGLLNPVAVFDSVNLYGTIVSRASLHNVSILSDMKIHIGDRIQVTKANMIIPFVVKNLSADNHEDYTIEELEELIGSCPTCGEKAIISRSNDGILTAMCPNDSCPEKLIGKLAHFCSRDCMDIQGMSEETIKKLVDAGFIKEYADFFGLYFKPEIQYMPGFGKQSWDKMCDAALKAKNTTFVKFITALSITNIGKGQAKALYQYISTNYDTLVEEVMPDWVDLEEEESYQPVFLFRWMALKEFDFSRIEGFGKITSDEIIKWAKEHWTDDSPETRVLVVVNFTDERPGAASAGAVSLDGKSFCITGKLVTYPNREALVAVIEQHGGKFVSSVSSKTDYLINNDTTSTSGKNKKAKELNIPIISEADFLAMVQ